MLVRLKLEQARLVRDYRAMILRVIARMPRECYETFDDQRNSHGRDCGSLKIQQAHLAIVLRVKAKQSCFVRLPYVQWNST